MFAAYHYTDMELEELYLVIIRGNQKSVKPFASALLQALV